MYRHTLANGKTTMIEGTDSGMSPFFSPDGKWIAFGSGNKLHKISVDGGRAITIAEVQGPAGGAWLADGTIVFTPFYSEGLSRINADGSGAQRLTTPDRDSGELGHFWPSAVPGGRYVIFTAFRTPVAQSRVGVVDLTTKDVRWLVEGAAFGRYVPTGHLLYAKSDRLYAAAFDAATGTTSGPAVEIVDDLPLAHNSASAPFDVSSKGVLAYLSRSVANAPADLVWLDRSGQITPAGAERRDYLGVSLSPDDSQAALTIGGESLDVWTYAFARRTLSRLTSSPASEFQPAWSADGRELFYVNDRPLYQLYRIGAAQPDSGKPLFTRPTAFDTFGVAASPDGAAIAFSQQHMTTGTDLFAARLDGSAAPTTIAASKGEDSYPTFSPDGRFVAYRSDETGRSEIYVQPFPGPGERIQVSSQGGAQPFWARNGELFYWQRDQLQVAALKPGRALEFSEARTLFSFPIVSSPPEGLYTYAVTRDGARFLAISEPDALRPRRLEVITNFGTFFQRLAQ